MPLTFGLLLYNLRSKPGRFTQSKELKFVIMHAGLKPARLSFNPLP